MFTNYTCVVCCREVKVLGFVPHNERLLCDDCGDTYLDALLAKSDEDLITECRQTCLTPANTDPALLPLSTTIFYIPPTTTEASSNSTFTSTVANSAPTTTLSTKRSPSKRRKFKIGTII
ncbi:hypothetical protein FOZ60_016379 [Perkinsus olseni]|uniref:Uncharacterized protein n=1 Tax=Perkinsus olseni TaxID=32597 RepID=A0A7J6P5I1_PEROL|nr:hypothetical protein FOZ60_016379 [Perkinsus olseni]